jgi:hypothetical protein
LTDGRQPPVPASVVAALAPGRVPPVAGPTELEDALRAIVGPGGYARSEWVVRREYAFAEPANAAARLLGSFGLAEDELTRAEDALESVLIPTERRLVLHTDHRVVGLTWSPPA